MMLSPDLMSSPIVDEDTYAFYQQAVPNITFYISGLGSSFYDYDNAGEFYYVFKDTPTADVVEKWDGFDSLIANLNSFSRRVMEHPDFGREYGGY